MSIKTYMKNGKCLYEVYVGGLDARGLRWQRRRTNIETKRKAEVIEFELKRELAKAREECVSPRWEEFIKECFNILKVNYRPSTMYSYQTTVDKWLMKPWKGLELKEITKKRVHELVFEEMNSTEHTKKYVLKIIKRIMQVALDLGYITHNPAQGMQVKVPEADKKVLTNSEAQLFLAEAKSTNHRFYPVWLVALFTGMRSGELYALRWSDVDLESLSLSVSRSWSSKNGFTGTKNQKSRIVPISKELLDYLKELKLQCGQEEFVLPRLNEWERGEAAHVTRGFCKSLGITEVKFHDLRATFITNLLARGESLVRVMAIVGHADMETTNVYLRKAGIELAGGTEKLGYTVPKEHEANVINVSFS